jgi:hypothetical protein
MIVYKMIAEGKHRYVVNGFKQDKFNYDQPNDDIIIIHYDIETEQDVRVRWCGNVYRCGFRCLPNRRYINTLT